MSQLAVIETDAVVASMNRARMALSEAKTIQQTKLIVDTAAAAEIYARRQKLGEEASDLALSIKIEALRKLGGMLEQTPRHVGGRPEKTGTETELVSAPTLAELGLSKKESALAQKLNALPEKDYQQVRDGNISVAKAIAAVDAGKTKAKAQSKSKKKTGAESAPVSSAPAPAPLHVVAPTGDVITDDVLSEDPAALLEELQRDNEELQKQIAILTADDTKAELHKMILQRDHAVRRQSEEMDKAHKSTEREKWTKRQLMRCGKAIGEEEPSKIAAAVEAFVREHRKAA